MNLKRKDWMVLAVLWLLTRSSSSKGGGAVAPASGANEVPQRATGGSNWTLTRYQAAFDAVGKLLPDLDAEQLHEVAVSAVALWAVETGYGRMEWNFNVGNVINVGSQQWFRNAGDGRTYAAYPSLADAVDAWATLLRSSKYQNATVQLIENPSSDQWVTMLGQAGYFEANVTTYVKAYDGARANVAKALASQPAAGTTEAQAPSVSTSTTPTKGKGKVIPIRIAPRSSAANANALQTAKQVMQTATTQNMNWGSGQGSPANALAANYRYQGMTSQFAMQAPPPLPSEGIDHYYDRVLGGDWAPGSGAMGWLNGLADTIGAAAFSALSSTLGTMSLEVDPSGTLKGAISSVNATIQQGLAADKANA